MSLLNCRNLRSVVLSSALSRSFVAVPHDGKACRLEPLLTPERLRS